MRLLKSTIVPMASHFSLPSSLPPFRALVLLPRHLIFDPPRFLINKNDLAVQEGLGQKSLEV